ncbi:hypothetical protein EAH86_09695 [Pedococcus bigeumensis]|uniref:Uncharacterized protein n=1 Tax=Pedococcus bigeumensis TaxID=433644 RepID=A0A502CY02_9MICO|nr:hypothetical protein EAH86_09695 [Pedococcus bigeumensis]
MDENGDDAASSQTQPETRAGRHSGMPSARLTPASLYWHLTKAPRRRIWDPENNPIRSGLLILIGILAAFGQAARDIANQAVWWAPFRGLAALIGGLVLIWGVIAYLGRPATASKPSLIAKFRSSHRSKDAS